MRHGWCESGGTEETLKDRGKVEAAVEAPLELREVAGEMPCAHPAADAEQTAFQVAENRVHPRESRVLGVPPAAGQDLDLVMLQDRAEAQESCHPIRQDVGGLGDGTPGPTPDRPALEVHQLGELQVEHLAPIECHIRGGLDGRQEGGSPAGPTACGPVVTLAAHVGVVHLYPSGEDAALLPVQHHLHELVLHRPGGLVGHPDLPHQFQGRDGVLPLGEQVHGQEPGGQRQLGTVEDGPSRKAGLPVTGVALIQPTPGQDAAVPAATIGADEAPGPAGGEQCLGTLLLGAVPALELRHRQALLKLAGRVGHWDPPGAGRPPKRWAWAMDISCPPRRNSDSLQPVPSRCHSPFKLTQPDNQVIR